MRREIYTFGRKREEECTYNDQLSNGSLHLLDGNLFDIGKQLMELVQIQLIYVAMGIHSPFYYILTSIREGKPRQRDKQYRYRSQLGRTEQLVLIL